MGNARKAFAGQADASTQLVQIEKPIYGGAFLARVEGKAVFVPLALPGEQARVRIVEEKRGYATAEVEEIVAAAPERIAPACRHFGACGGCQYQHAEYAAQLEFKKAILRETLERGGVHAPEEIAVLAGEPWAYRNRIRRGVRCGGQARISRTAVACGGSDCRVPDCCAAAGAGCACRWRDCCGSCFATAAERDFAFLQCRRRLRCWRAS